jgi:ubiquinone/menaquinone biosynthesis C-methylase UbiE
MALSYCPQKEAFFCATCAQGREEIAGPFWAWNYYFSYRSPWSGQWQPALDRLEYDGRHPLQQVERAELVQQALDEARNLMRYPPKIIRWPSGQEPTNAEVQANWNRNAQRWDEMYDEDGDRNRRYISDEPMLAMLGDVQGQSLLDVGSGNGYLCRKLARQGALMTGVELSDQFIAIALQRETTEPLGITYHQGSASEMDFLPDGSIDMAVSNYVLMDVSDYIRALEHIYRVLRPGGIFVCVISHPCFSSGPGGWVIPAPDTPRREDWYALQVDNYFLRGPYFAVWGDFDPVLGFHRPLRDYWQAFTETGFMVEGFEEPSITERGRRELPLSLIEYSQRITYSCIFQLRKADG